MYDSQDLFDKSPHLQNAAEPANKFFVAVTAEEFAARNNEFIFGRSSLILLKENIKTSYSCLVYKAESPFKKIFDIKLIQLHESGIIANLTSKIDLIENSEKEIGPEVLTMEHLEIGFLAWLVPLIISVVCFVFEIGSKLCLKLFSQVAG